MYFLCAWTTFFVYILLHDTQLWNVMVMVRVSMKNDKNREKIHIEELWGLNASFQEFMHV
jgi:hypothetical protein